MSSTAATATPSDRLHSFARQHALQCFEHPSLPGGPVIPGGSGIIVEQRGRLVAGPNDYPTDREIAALRATEGSVRDKWPGFAFRFDERSDSQVAAALKLVRPVAKKTPTIRREFDPKETRQFAEIYGLRLHSDGTMSTRRGDLVVLEGQVAEMSLNGGSKRSWAIRRRQARERGLRVNDNTRTVRFSSRNDAACKWAAKTMKARVR